MATKVKTKMTLSKHKNSTSSSSSSLTKPQPSNCRVFVRKHSYENEFNLQVHCYANQTHFHVTGFAHGLVLKQRPFQCCAGLGDRKANTVWEKWRECLQDARINKLTPVFMRPVLLLIINFVITLYNTIQYLY